MDTKKTTQRLSIAIIHPDLGIGGAERLIIDAAVQLTSKGHDVHVFTAHHDKNRCFEETLLGSFPVIVYGSFLPRHILNRFHALFAYIRCLFVALCVFFIWKAAFDVVLVDQVSVIVPLLKLKKSVKVVYYCHFPDLLLAQHTTFLRRFYRKPMDYVEELTTGKADVILVNSKFTASVFASTFKYLSARGIQPAVLYPAVNVNQFKSFCFDKLNFLSINRFERKKNLGLAIEAFSKMIQTVGKEAPENLHLTKVSSLTIAGGYDERLKENVEYLVELKNLAQKKGLSKQISFITSCSTAKRNELLAECLCVIYTPQNEHFGIVPLEAMAACKPIIACNSGGPLETVVNEVTGFLCRPNPSDFSDAMVKLLVNPGNASVMGRAARAWVSECFSTNIFGQRLNQYLINVTSKKSD